MEIFLLWKKFENFANRVLLIITNLNKIAEIYYKLLSDSKDTGMRRREGYNKIVNISGKTMIIEAYEYREMIIFFQWLDGRLRYHYSNFKGIVIALEKLIKLNEEIKRHIEPIESKIKDSVRFEITGKNSLNWNYIAEEMRRILLSAKDEEISLGSLIDKLDRFFEQLRQDTDEIIKQKVAFDLDNQLKARFFVNWGKLAGIFDEINKLLQQGKSQEKFVRQLFDEVYNLLLHFPKEYAPTEEVELVIKKLEQAYDKM